MNPVARLLARWLVIMLWLDRRVDHRLWNALPYRLRHRWASEWLAGYAAPRWRDER